MTVFSGNLQFLNLLPIYDAERCKLAELAPRSALDLLARRRAAKEAFDAHVGIDRADIIAAALESTLTQDERDALNAPAPPRHRLGARLNKR